MPAEVTVLEYGLLLTAWVLGLYGAYGLARWWLGSKVKVQGSRFK